MQVDATVRGRLPVLNRSGRCLRFLGQDQEHGGGLVVNNLLGFVIDLLSRSQIGCGFAQLDDTVLPDAHADINAEFPQQTDQSFGGQGRP
ncbi:MAG: hypothetical protein BMS9Abin28_1961 [Anaerolineae bacterium]|nr:MAG: hypothetical protein BMS9Abin28_1961 [Anaerolineae bacterium]